MRLTKIACVALAIGCAPYDRPEDQFALRDSVRQLNAMPHCEHPIEVFEPGQLVLRAHRSIASLSASCSPGSPRVCKQTLLKRACELEADALLFDAHTGSGGQQLGANFELKPMSAHALRWTD